MADFADQVAEWLDATAGQLARDTEQQESTAASPEQVDLVFAFRRLWRYLEAFLPRVVLGEVDADEWRMLSSALGAISRECHWQVAGAAEVPRTAALGVQPDVLAAFRQVTGWPDEVVLHYAGDRGRCGCLPICGQREHDCAEAVAAWLKSGA